MKCHFRGNELTHGEETCRNWLIGSTTQCHSSYICPCSYRSQEDRRSQRMHLSESWQSICRGNREKSRSSSRRAQGSWAQRYIKIHKTKQEVSRGTAKQICHHRPCNKRKPRDRLGPGESIGAQIWPKDQMDQRGYCDPQEQWQMYELWHWVVLPVDLLWQASSLWASSFPRKWHFTEKSRLAVNSEEGVRWRQNVNF